jgi:predicted Ser/Thr protein kinase
MRTDSLIGVQVAKYRIEALLGEGGMSRVYLAEHLGLGRKIALKLLAADLAEDESFRERFLRESRAAAALDHPNVIEIYDADEADGLLYIAMRYVHGSDLREIVKARGALSAERTLYLLGQAGSALDTAHTRGLVHRDVKPANVLIGARDHVYLSDFGVAKHREDARALTRTGFFVGTLDYAAPEQIRGEPLDGRADVYALGCILYQCLSGSLPYPKDSEVQLIYAHLEEPPPSLAATGRFSAGLDRVIATALAKRREERYSTCAQLIAAARAELAAAPIAAPPPLPPPAVEPAPAAAEPPPRTVVDRLGGVAPPPAPSPSRRELPRGLILGVAGAIVLAVLGAAGWFLLGDDAAVLASVRGRALDATTGKPVVGARVVVDGRTATTRRNGSFALSQVTEGEPVTVTACAYTPATVDAKETMSVRLARRPVTGSVKSDLTGAAVRAIVRSGDRTARARSNGTFSLWGPCNGDRLAFSAAGHRTARVPVSAALEANVVLPALVVQDDFAHVPRLFDSSSSPSAEAARRAGAYHVRVHVTSTPVGARQPIRAKVRLRDVTVTASARRRSGSADDSFGVFCRWRGARGYYLFEVSADGFARIEKHAGGRATELRSWRPSTAIRTGSAANRLAATCEGYPATRLTFSVNGATVARARDPRGLPAGSVGVAASGYAKPGPLVVFDDVSVRRL